ncbi:hypothetical protein F5B17DRAFT_424128 [Nemania serpens]|nr:hypothetical protein F5B17DRAFT_424128 [Nemania serpens]
MNDKKLCQKHDKKTNTDFCLASMLGTSIQSLHGTGLWPAEIRWSILILSDKLKAVKIKSVKHQCSQGLVLHIEIEKVLGSVPSLLAGGHGRHLDAQAKKSGVLNL